MQIASMTALILFLMIGILNWKSYKIMIDALAFIFFLLTFASLICLIVGLIVPSIFRGIFRRNLGRKKTGLVFSGVTLGLFILFCVLALNSTSSSSQQNKSETTANKPTIAPSISPVKKNNNQVAKKPTPVPTEDCSESVNPQLCNQMQINREPRLNATVNFSNAGLMVTNNDNVDWTLCDVSIGVDNNINTAYSLSGFSNTFPAHQTTTIPWGDLTQDNGNRFDYATTQPTDLTIDCTVNKEDEHLRVN